MQKNKIQLRHRLIRWVLYSILGFIVSTSLLVMSLAQLPVDTSSFMIQRHISDFNNDRGFVRIDQQWREQDAISPHLFHAVIAAEDQRFYQHHGLDFDAILSAFKHNQAGGKIRGASTITQQVAKNLFLTPSRSVWRKGLEAWFSLLIELFWSKQRILLVYVNIAEFGDHLFGAEAASQHYFSISADKLTASQAALLAGSLPNPLIFKVDKPSRGLRYKQQWILGQMRNLGYL
ncbi:MAG: monofunctional biosynthetic peptidoglycan transglycosylase [Gammaproteobacteria bacterium]|nr:MAG: monofunctional biosynthetic peptidoglycan transglycosylase [Gammaproteobacteria bacterium]